MNERHLMHVIALCGLSTAGKTTAADYIQEEFGAVRLRFAKPLRDMLQPLGLTQAELWGDKKQVPCDALNGCTPEYVLRELGMWVRRTLGADFLALQIERQLEEKLNEVIYPTEFVVLDDLRCVNEREALRRFQKLHDESVRVHIVNVHRAAALQRIDPATLDSRSPKYVPLEGEHKFFTYDYVIYNDSTPEDFYKSLRQFVHEIEAGGRDRGGKG